MAQENEAATCIDESQTVESRATTVELDASSHYERPLPSIPVAQISAAVPMDILALKEIQDDYTALQITNET